MAGGGARLAGRMVNVTGNVTQGKGQGKMKYIQRDDPAPPTGREKEGIPPPL
jgi:hypothetical protein